MPLTNSPTTGCGSRILTTDLIYIETTLGTDGGMKIAYTLSPQIDSISVVNTVDLLGNGCACLVWTHPLAARGQTLQYIDLMNG